MTLKLLEEKILAEIEKSKQELVDLTLTLGNIYSPTGQETEIMNYLYTWMNENGFEPRLIGPSNERANVLGRLKGAGGGLTVAFNSHMDVTLGKNETWRLRVPNQKINYEAWLENNVIYGNGVMNDKGPMACWLVAAKALRNSGIQLKGDILLSAVIGEIGHEPVDEYTGIEYIGKDFGTRFLITHGGTADVAIVAEASDLKPGWVEAGKAFFKITIMAGPSKYTPYCEHYDNYLHSGNAIVQTSVLIQAIERWAIEYENRNIAHYEGGTVAAKASIGAIRGGLPYLVIRPPEVCALYLDVRLLPGANPLDIREELYQLLVNTGIEGEVEIYMHRPGYEAQGVLPIVEDLGKAYETVTGEVMPRQADVKVTSMWRDTNPYAEYNIPALTYGPGGGSGGGGNALVVEDMVKAAKIYALTAYHLAQRDRRGFAMLKAK